jgi:NADH-quinone oxidoreductase subunit M
MLNHGLSTGALFLLVGVIYERRHTRLISEFGGLMKVMPMFGLVFMIVTLSSIGLPPLNGFIGEFLILLGAFKFKVWYAVLAATGVVLGAIYMLWMYQRVFFGELKSEVNKVLKDLSPREIIVFIPVLVMIVFMGVYSKPFLSRMEPAVKQFVAEVKQGRRDIGVTYVNNKEISWNDARPATDAETESAGQDPQVPEPASDESEPPVVAARLERGVPGEIKDEDNE